MVNGPEAGGLNCVCVGALLALGVRPADAQAWTAFGPAGQRLLDPLMLAFGLILLLCITFFLWSRERRLRRQRERLRKTYSLGEEILSASSPEAILKRVSASLTAVLGVTRVHLYVYNRTTKTLDALADRTLRRGFDLAFLAARRDGSRRRRLLPLPHAAGDSGHRSQPLPHGPQGWRASAQESLLFVPMLTQGEVTGVLGLDQDDRVRDFTAGRTGAGAAPGQPDRRGLPPAGPALGAGTAVPHRKAGRRGPADFRRGQRAANAAGLHFRPGPPRARKGHAGPARSAKSRPSPPRRREPPPWSRAWSRSPPSRWRRVRSRITTLLHNLIEFREGDWKASGIKRPRPDRARTALRAGVAGPVGAGISESAGACRAVSGGRAPEGDHGAHQRAGQAAGGGGRIYRRRRYRASPRRPPRCWA